MEENIKTLVRTLFYYCKHSIIVHFLILGALTNIIAQENKIGTPPTPITQKTGQFKIPDSLSNQDFSYLSKMFYRTMDSIELAKVYALSYILKGEEFDNDQATMKGYYFLSRITQDSMKITYLDHVIKNSLNKNYKKEPARSYLSKGDYFFDKRKYKFASENYLLASREAEKKENKFLKYKTRFNIGLLKSRLGKYKEASKIFNSYYDYYYDRIQSEKKHPKLTQSYLIALYAKSDTYTRLMKTDSATIFNRLGAEISYKNNFSVMAKYFVLLEGVNQYFNKNYKTSIDSISKTIPFFENYNDKSNLLYSNIFLGKSYQRLNDTKNTIKYYKIVDELFSENSDFAPEIRDSYSYLIKHYKSSKDFKNQLKSLEKMILVDSLLNDSYKYINNNIISKYDTPKLLDEKDQLIKKLNGSENIFKPIIILLILALILISIILYRNNVNKKLYKNRFETLLNASNEELSKESRIIEKEALDIPNETMERIRKGLFNFEQKKSFLDKNITLNKLSKTFKTNSNYLSKAINHLENKKITDYINDLRVDYAISKIKEDEKFRKYTIKAIADSTGFSNPVSFSQAFYKKTGIKPSYFIKELNKKQHVKH